MEKTEINDIISNLISAIDSHLFALGYREDPQEAEELVALLDDPAFDDFGANSRFAELSEKLLNRTLPGLQMFVRDVNLPAETAEQYAEGMILCNPCFTDASHRIGGMVTSHRFAILSNHMAELSQVTGIEDKRGLVAAKPFSYFQVLKIHTSRSGETMLLLLHLPSDGSWPFFNKVRLSVMDDIIDDCIDRFENKLIECPIEELTTADWLNRCSAPIGIDDSGCFYEL